MKSVKILTPESKPKKFPVLMELNITNPESVFLFLSEKTSICVHSEGMFRVGNISTADNIERHRPFKGIIQLNNEE